MNLGHLLPFSQDEQGAGSKVKQSGLGSAPIWDVGSAGGNTAYNLQHLPQDHATISRHSWKYIRQTPGIQ